VTGLTDGIVNFIEKSFVTIS